MSVVKSSWNRGSPEDYPEMIVGAEIKVQTSDGPKAGIIKKVSYREDYNETVFVIELVEEKEL